MSRRVRSRIGREVAALRDYNSLRDFSQPTADHVAAPNEPNQGHEALEILRKNPVHGKKTKKRKQPVLEINQPSTRPALTCCNDDDQVMDHVTAAISL